MKKLILINCACGLLYISGFAQYVSVETAQRVADNFFHAQSHWEIQDQMSILELGDSETPTMYAISATNRWVLISADKRVQPILAYSQENGGSFPQVEKIPATMQYMLKWYSEQIEIIRNDNIFREYDSRWDAYLEGNNRNINVIVGPLIRRDGLGEPFWIQRGDNNNVDDSIKCYNKFCPSSASNLCSNGHMVAGCVPVAFGQIMWYWHWPLIKKTQTNDYRAYNWNMMPCAILSTTSQERADEIATLLHDIGIAVHIDYGCLASHTTPDSIVSNIQNEFHYLASNIIYRNNYTNTAWINMIKTELNNMRPVFYAGFANIRNTMGLSGHAFVIDGYDSNNMFHINQGSGINGYFSLENFTYNINQSMIKNIQPIDISCSPIVIPSSDVWDTNFMIQHRGGISVGNRTLTYGMNGAIASGNYVRLTSGFKVNAGARVFITCDEIECENRDEEQSSEILLHTHFAPRKQNISHATKLLHNGQILILRGEKTYTVTGQEVR